jgi:hypothetical protein
MNPVTETVLRKLDEILTRLAAVESRVAMVADDVDELDRYNRPHGDGTRVRRGWRRS